MRRDYQHQEIPAKRLSRLMRGLGLCPHANAGWPIRCRGEAKPWQHCYDCGAQRTYALQPSLKRGPWMRRQMDFPDPVEATWAPSRPVVLQTS